MGSSSSRPGPRPPRPPRTHHHHRHRHRHRTSKRKFLSSLLICGGSSSHAPIEMEEDPAELRVRSAEHSDPVVSKLQSTTKESVLTSGTETGFSIPKIVNTALPESGVIATEDPFPEDCSANVGISNQGKHLSESKELVPPHPPGVDQRSSDRASTSYEDQPPPDRAMGRANMDVLSDIDYVTEADVPECISPSLQEQGDSCSDRASIENHASEVTSVHNSESGSASVVSDSSVTYDSLRDGNLQEGIPSGLGFLVSERERRRDGGVLHLDVVSISSNILSSSSPDINNREARRNSRRLFWDAFSRRSSRRHSDSRTFVFSTDDSDDSGPNDRWLLDFNGDFFDDGVGSDTGHLGSRTDSINERRWHSRSEIWERLRGSRNERDRRTTVCPSGLHSDGTCTCESASMSEESGAHASISRIVMLAEALFEVLDEIHRQPVSLSLSMVSLPAPESVVDALPVKNHKSTVKTGNDVEQCYICLAEYEEGDKIRVLPCHHEYHMSCVDKWLKEIHGVCPLCRGDVREGFTEGSLSNSESPSN